MNVHANIPPRLSALALCLLSACLLPACGGGSAGGMVMVAPPLTPPPPPTPPGASCPAPITTDCVTAVPNFQSDRWDGGAQSDHALFYRGPGQLNLSGDFRFGNGAFIERGYLNLSRESVLRSNTTVQSAATMNLWGGVVGDVINHGTLNFGGTVAGNLTNHGQLIVPASIYDDPIPARIDGNYRQSPTATLSVMFGGISGGTLQVTGRADIEGGTLELHQYTDDWGPYPLPAAPFSHHVLQAGGGVFGQFTNWTSPGLFITGSLRYMPNDIYFDATSLSAQRVMIAAGFRDAVIVGTASNFDDALGEAGALMGPSGTPLTTTQDQFLRSVASIQRIRDYGEATTTFDSLSGHGHAAAVGTLLQQAVGSGSQSSRHTRGLRPGSQALAWPAQPAETFVANGTFTHATTTSHDQWLNDNLLLGSRVGWSRGDLRFDRSGGSARSRSPQWNLYLHRRGDNGAYAMGDVGHARHQLALDRRIDLGREVHVARSERQLDVTHAYVETGRALGVGYGSLTPFTAVGYAAVRGDGFREQGDTGFEFIAGPSFHTRVTSEAGVRYARQWRWGGRHWLQLDLGAGYQHVLNESDGMRAAFTGTPGQRFEVSGLPHGRGNGWMEMNLAGGSGTRWSWLLAYQNRDSSQAVSMQFGRAF